MPAAKITGAEYPLKKIFSNDFVFSIPDYQRPYSWTTEQAGELLDDILSSVAGLAGPLADLDPYFLGSIVLIKSETSPEAEVVDGQQRLTTLTILLAVLCQLVASHEEKESLRGYVYEKGNAIEEIPDRPRLTVGSRSAAFFQTHIQTDGGIETLLGLDAGGLHTDAERNIQANAALFHERLGGLEQADLKRLSQYLLLNCYLVAVGTPNLSSAYRIFSVLNERGLDLSHSDILKAEIIGAIEEADRPSYTTKWEDAEEALGRGPFGDLFAHVRMVWAKRKMREGVLKEFRSIVVPAVAGPKQLIDDVVVPYADAYGAVLNETFETAGNAVAINRTLHWLHHLGNVDWVPPALKVMVKYRNEPETIAHFLKDLDRIASSMEIRGLYVTPRLERYGKLLDLIDDGGDIFAPDSPLQLTQAEIADTKARLDGPVYQDGTARYLLLRLDESMSAGGATYDYPVISVEHVLPQKMKDDSQWAKDFNPETHDLWVHRLGNLVLLTRRKNSQANNFDFDYKKAAYFSAAGGVSPFAITTQVLQLEEWTLTQIQARQVEMASVLATLWRLDA